MIIEASSDYILKVIKPFYSILEVGNYCFAIYHNYYINDFFMTKSIYDPCLLYKYEPFGIVSLQTDNILILTNNTFVAIEEKAIKIAKLMTKK